MAYKACKNKIVNNYVNFINKEKTWSNDNLDLDDHYVFGKDYLDNHYEIFKDLNPKFLFQFGIIIPFDLPFQNKEFSIGKFISEDNKCLITFIFTSIEEQGYFYAGFLPSQRCEYPSVKTRCEITFSFQKPIISISGTNFDIKDNMLTVRDSKKGIISSEQFYKSVNNVFKIFDELRNISLYELSCLIMAYSIVSTDISVKPLTSDDIEFLSHFRGIEVSTWKTFNWMHLHNFEKFPDEKKEPVSNEVFSRSLAFAHEFYTNQFLNYFYHINLSEYAISQGNKTNALIELNVAIEVLIDSIITLYWENEEGLSSNDSNSRLETISYKRRLTSIMQTIIGGNWDVTDDKSEFSVWFNKSYNLRNRIIHAGYDASKSELFESIKISYIFIDYIIDLIIKTKYDYLKDIMRIPMVKIINMGDPRRKDSSI